MNDKWITAISKALVSSAVCGVIGYAIKLTGEADYLLALLFLMLIWW